VEDRVISKQEATPDAVIDRVIPSPGNRQDAATGFPKLLERLREERGLSKADLAKRASYDPSTITRFEQGSRGPDRDAVLQLAEAMTLPLIDRDRLLAAAGFRSVLWDDPQLIELAEMLADPHVPASTRKDVRSVIQLAISHCKLNLIGH
jgi:transcriptional regulator with XRE-family HTH domain